MRFVCETCQTRYIIPDERARGRVLKVRCKKCGNVIILRADVEVEAEVGAEASSALASSDRSSPSGEATQMVDSEALRLLREESARPSPKSDPPLANKPSEELAEWHVILSGKQTGPVPVTALIERMLNGQMTARSYVWRDGMGDWKRAEEISEIARWLPAQPSPTPPPGRIPQAPSQDSAARKQRNADAAQEPPRKERRAKVDDAVDAFFQGAEANDDPVFAQQGDPFSQVQDAPGLKAPKPGEVTKFFITQAGVTKTRSPWRFAVWGFGSLVLLAGGVVGLSRLGVNVPLMPPDDSRNQHVFNGGSADSTLRELLYGRKKPAPVARAPGTAPATPASAQTRAEQGGEQKPLARKAEQHVDQLNKSDKDQLRAIYATQQLGDLHIKPSSASAPVIDRTDAPLTPEQVARTVARFQGSYAACIERELKRNPNFQGGKIRVVTTILSSGIVRQAQIQSDDARLQRTVAGGALGVCLIDQTRRMVFPNFSGDPFDAEIPLVLNSSM